MIRYVRVQLNPTGFTYDIYSGTSISGITDLVCDDVTNFCDFPISNTISDTTIYLKLVSKDCVDQIVQVYIGPPDCSFEISVQEVLVNIWLPETRCEKETIFGIRKTITGISSPTAVWYDSQTERVYVADADDYIRGNIYWFDPVTATSVNDMVYYSGNSLTGEGRLRYNALRNAFIDPIYRRIYLVGSDFTGRDGNTTTRAHSGFTVYDIDTDTHRTVLVYGSYNKFERDFLFVTDQYIYLNDFVNRSFIRLNRNDLSGRIDIPFNNGNLQRQRFLEQTPIITRIGNYLWLVSSGSGQGTTIPTTDDIGIFDNDFNLINTITIPNTDIFDAGWSNCCFYRQNLFFDQTSNKVYMSDMGSSQRFIIQPNSNYTGGTIIYSESLSGISENRKYVNCTWSVDPFNNNLYESVGLINCEKPSYCTPNPKSKTYLVDRSTYGYTRLLDNTSITQLSFVNDGLSNSVMGFARNSEFLSGTAFPNWNTDGTITIYNNTIQGDNTGNVIVNQLIEYNSVTNLPTGNVKPNDPNDPDYVTSPYFDTNSISGCPISYTTDCPTLLSGLTGNTLSYELSLKTSTRLNPIISAISVTQIYELTNVTGGTIYHYGPYSSNYLSGQFPGVPNGSLVDIRVRLISTGNTVLNTCNF